MYKLIIFDVDGTIANTDKVLIKTYKTLYKMYEPNVVPSVKKIKTFSGPPLAHTLSTEYPDYPLDFITKEYKRISKGNYVKYLKTFRFCRVILEKLKKEGYILALATSKYIEATHFSLNLMNFEGLFDYMVCGDEIEHNKPAPDCLNKIVDHYKIDKSEVLFVGDTIYDYQCAKNAGVNIAIMEFMKREFGDDFHPDFECKSFLKLYKYIKNYGK